VHPSGGTSFCYGELVRALGPGQPVWAYTAPGLLGEAPALELPALAARYVAELRAITPVGPYRLGGWSLGGVVAFEMARQLEAVGESVDLLAMIDVAPPGPREAEPGEDELARVVEDQAGLAGVDGSTLPVEGLFDLFRANRRALRAYRPGAYGGPALLIRAEESAEPADGFEAWLGLAGAGSEVHVLPGDHYSLLRHPGVSAVGELLEGRR
jgi:thioesterase domain-containing protein